MRSGYYFSILYNPVKVLHVETSKIRAAIRELKLKYKKNLASACVSDSCSVVLAVAFSCCLVLLAAPKLANLCLQLCEVTKVSVGQLFVKSFFLYNFCARNKLYPLLGQVMFVNPFHSFFCFT